MGGSSLGGQLFRKLASRYRIAVIHRMGLRHRSICRLAIAEPRYLQFRQPCMWHFMSRDFNVLAGRGSTRPPWIIGKAAVYPIVSWPGISSVVHMMSGVSSMLRPLPKVRGFLAW
jgi:hypothetical protein